MSQMSDRGTWATPPDFWEWLTRRVQPDVDICATAENAKCERYVTPEMDALAHPWLTWCEQGEWVWCNPPYSNLMPWVDRAIEAMYAGVHVLMLTHDNFSSDWFAKLEATGPVIRLLAPRIQFVPGPGVKASSPDRCNILWDLRWWGQSEIRYERWK